VLTVPVATEGEGFFPVDGSRRVACKEQHGSPMVVATIQQSQRSAVVRVILDFGFERWLIMAVIITRRSEKLPKSVAQPAAKKKGHCKPLPVTIDLNQPGRLRVGHCLTLFSVSHASFYRGLGKKYPKPDGNDGRPYWSTATISRSLN